MSQWYARKAGQTCPRWTNVDRYGPLRMLAHAGHWLASLIYVVPVLGLVGYLGWQRLRDRRR